MDTLKGVALIATFIGFLSIFATWVLLCRIACETSVRATRGAIYDARLIAPALHACDQSWSWWWTARSAS